jgi:hypothetical protein
LFRAPVCRSELVRDGVCRRLRLGGSEDRDEDRGRDAVGAEDLLAGEVPESLSWEVPESMPREERQSLPGEAHSFDSGRP